VQYLAALGRVRAVPEAFVLARPGALVRQAVRVYGPGARDALCELDASGLSITDRHGRRDVAWQDIRSVAADRGRVRIASPSGPIDLAIALDGVCEPDLAPLFAGVLADGRRGALDTTGALHELALAIDRKLEGFGDADDPVIPLAVGGFAVVAGVILAVAVPVLSQLAARITPAPGSYAILPHLSSFDPRVLVAAFAAGAALAAVVGRVALGPAAEAWARGTLRGWHHNAAGAEDLLRRGVAQLVLQGRIVALVAAAAFILALPSAFARTVIDVGGIHSASGLPFLSTDLGWSQLSEVVPVAVGFGERQEGFVTMLVFTDGSRVSTRGRDLVGGSERAFYDFSRAHAR
jgi:hypothetical protein